MYFFFILRCFGEFCFAGEVCGFLVVVEVLVRYLVIDLDLFVLCFICLFFVFLKVLVIINFN